MSTVCNVLDALKSKAAEGLASRILYSATQFSPQPSIGAETFLFSADLALASVTQLLH